MEQIGKRWEKIKSSFQSGKIKKDNFLILLLMGILLLVIVWPGSDTKSTKSGQLDSKSDILNLTKGTADLPKDFETGGETQEKREAYEAYEAYAVRLEHKLEEVLSMMEGAGKVKAMITFNSSEERVVEKDTPSKRAGSTEVDGAGGSRNTTDMDQQQETVLLSDGAGKTYPFIKKTIRPEIEGVVVAAQGGENVKIVKNITEAIVALFGIDEHKIKIVKMISY